MVLIIGAGAVGGGQQVLGPRAGDVGDAALFVVGLPKHSYDSGLYGVFTEELA
jgi:hypothetical protein